MMDEKVVGGHAPAALREPLIDLLNAHPSADVREWWEGFESPQAARQLLGRLWNCTDPLPARTRRTARELLGCDEADVVTYSQLVQRLRATLPTR